MEDHGFGMNGRPATQKYRWYKDKKWWWNFGENVVGVIGIILVISVVVFAFDILGELTVRDNYIKSVEPVVVTGIHDNSMPQFSDGKEIHSKEYLYYLDYADTTGTICRHEINTWSPWLSGDSTYGVCVGDTLNLYKFHSDGIVGIRGYRIVFEKGGNYYE